MTQQPLPLAPKFDRYGLHAYDCECARCALGYRPTVAERDHARRVWERAERAKAEAAKQATQPKPISKALARADAFRAAEKRTTETIKRMNEPAKEPATPAQLAELRAEFPSIRRRQTKGTRR